MHLLGGLPNRLIEERKRIGINQEEFGSQMGVAKRTQAGYEAGKSYPDAAYFIKAKEFGVDVIYVMFGTRSESCLSEPEQRLLSLFRQAGPEGKGAAIGALEGGLKAISVTIQGDNYGQTGGKIINKSGVTFGRK